MTRVISGVVTLKNKTKSNPLTRLNVSIISKSVVGFYSFPSVAGVANQQAEIIN